MGQIICSWKSPKLSWNLLIYTMKGWASVTNLQVRESLSQRVIEIEITRGAFHLETRRLWFMPCLGKHRVIPESPGSVFFSAPFSLYVLPPCVWNALVSLQCCMPNSAFKSDLQILYAQIASFWSVSMVLPKGLFVLWDFWKGEDGVLRTPKRRTNYVII